MRQFAIANSKPVGDLVAIPLEMFKPPDKIRSIETIERMGLRDRVMANSFILGARGAFVVERETVIHDDGQERLDGFRGWLAVDLPAT